MTGSNETSARIGIGIDTGGTYTDAVAVDMATGELISKAKSPTTRDDLARGVRGALTSLDVSVFDNVHVVALSTTLATNSIVEGKGALVGLLVAVPDPASFELPARLPAAHVRVIAGAHSPDGSLRTPLDEAAARAAIAEMAPLVDSFAVSSYFSIANDEHEVSLKALIEAVSEAPVVCGHELTHRIGMVERAVTATFNARLLPLIRHLLDAVHNTLADLGIDAPIMVVKGDGSLTAECVARSRPVETVLSGPAASVVGACRLSGLTNALVADLGGTTTDIAVVRGGMPEVNPEGALVGGWRTRVSSLDVRTAGLGGDSRVRATVEGGIVLGPERVVPLSVAAQRVSGVPEALSRLLEIGQETVAGQKRTRGRSAPDADESGVRLLTLVRRPAKALSPAEAALFDALDGTALTLAGAHDAGGQFADIEGLISAGVIAEIGFTPTDVLVAAGEFSEHDFETARMGALIVASSMRTDVNVLLAQVRSALEHRLALELVARALTDEMDGHEPTPDQIAVLERLIVVDSGGVLHSAFSLGVPLVAVGAPAAAWFPGIGRLVSADLAVPLHSEVANAYGALAGRVLERAQVRLKAEPDETFLVVTPTLRERHNDYATARHRAEEIASASARGAALAAGAPDAVVSLTFDEVVARQARTADDVFVELTVTATASGPPFI